MEKYILKKDRRIFCVTAKPYPDGIIDAFQTLEKLHPSICERSFYGISFDKKNGEIIYKAGVEETFEGEGEKYDCEIFVLKNGEYLSETIFNFMQKSDAIPNAFKKLTSYHEFDETFPLIEWYKNSKEIVCLVKIRGSDNC